MTRGTNTLQQKQVELSTLPVGSVEYIRIQLELNVFYQKVAQVLEEKFYPENYRSAYAILQSVPHGDLKAIFGAWLTELALLGCLGWETVTYYKSEYDRPMVVSRWISEFTGS